ncbi:unnamed protein product [Blepharisma stoltei]|uniref:Uncharacterized protein n=1 Tax=Blepharisma stoltei TaxID=1481888 RepID=A0AAU9JNQ6_9CILI|nr:unnamed protein product [Blepharisma stoltei]
MSEDSLRKRFSIFKKKILNDSETTTETPPSTFDETSINFELKGGPYNTNLIEASATVKNGQNAGMPLPLRCTWYRSTNEKQFVTIEGVNGAFYQPNADDIGCKICVHAVPVSEVEEYTGMPAFNEVGPVQIDPDMQKTVQEIYEANYAEFTTNLVGGTIENLIPGTVSIKLSGNLINVSYKDGSDILSTKLGMGSPIINLSQKTNTSFSMTFENERIDFNTEKHTERDIIAITIRMFCSKVSTENQADCLIKIEQLSTRLLNLNKDYERTVSALNLLKEEHKINIKTIEDDKARIAELEEENSSLLNQVSAQVVVFEKNETELKFLRQDILVYKTQCEALENAINQRRINDNNWEILLRSVKEDLEEILKKHKFCENCKRIENIIIGAFGKLDGRVINSHQSSANSSAKSYQDEGSENTEDHEKEIREFKDQILKYKCKLKQLAIESAELVNRAEAEKNFYKRKADSLAAENDKLLSKLGKNPKEITTFAKERQEFEAEKEKILHDLKEAQENALNYEKLGKINKKKLEEEIERNFELRKILSKKSKAMTSLDYQKIINSLTVTVADREEELCQQKNISRELMNRVQELESILKLTNVN